MPQNDYLLWAGQAGANVESQSNFAADPELATGVVTGKASSSQANKLWRQHSMWAAALGIVLNNYGFDALDDGVPGNLAAAFQSALQNLVTGLSSVLPSTGDAKLTFKTTADSGWVMMSDGTIGNAASNATERANADVSALFTLLWNNTTNAQCQLYNSAGTTISRGASASADFNSNAALKLPAAMGRALVVAGHGSGLATSWVLGQAQGEETHTLATNEMPSHNHSASVSDPGHGHGVSDPGHVHSGGNVGGLVTGVGGGSGGVTIYSSGNTGASGTGVSIAASGTGVSVGIGTAGSNAPHNNIQPSTAINVMIKL